MFPHAIASANIHIGTIAGKLNGVMPADDAERLADRVDVDARRGLLRVAALQQVRDPARELDDLEPARDLAERVGEHLAVLGGEEPRDVLAVLWNSSRTRNRISARRESDVARHAGNAAFAAATARSTSSMDAKSTAPVCLPVAGLYTGPLRPDFPATPSADPVVDRLDRGRRLLQRVGHAGSV